MIPPEGMQEVAAAIAGLVDQGKFFHNGQEVTRPPFRVNIETERIRVLLYLDDLDIGQFEYFSIMTKSGKVLFQKTGLVEKKESEGLVIAFSLQLQEVEA